MKKSRIYFGLIVLTGILGIALLSAGCLSSITMTSPGSAEAVGASALDVNLLGQDADWTLSRGCIWTVTLQVYNAGAVEERNINLHVELVNADTGAVRDSRSVFLGTMIPGSEKTVTVELDGDCIEEYTVRAISSTG